MNTLIESTVGLETIMLVETQNNYQILVKVEVNLFDGASEEMLQEFEISNVGDHVSIEYEILFSEPRNKKGLRVIQVAYCKLLADFTDQILNKN